MKRKSASGSVSEFTQGWLAPQLYDLVSMPTINCEGVPNGSAIGWIVSIQTPHTSSEDWTGKGEAVFHEPQTWRHLHHMALGGHEC